MLQENRITILYFSYLKLVIVEDVSKLSSFIHVDEISLRFRKCTVLNAEPDDFVSHLEQH